MIKYVTVLVIKQSMSREEFSRYWKNAHAPIITQITGLKGYIQNHALLDPSGNEPPYDGFGELYFESLEAMREGLASPEGEATLADIPNFCDTERLTRVRRRGEVRLEQDRKMSTLQRTLRCALG